MSDLKIRQGEWVVVCDGAKALVLENQGDEKFPNLRTREVYEQKAAKTHEQGTDAPGRSVNSVGAMRSAMDQTDWQTLEEQRFAAEIAQVLQVLVRERNIEQLVIAAPPRTLAELRRSLHDEVKKRVIAEIDKDLTNQPVDEIQRVLTAA